jgi:hypothetical protein
MPTSVTDCRLSRQQVRPGAECHNTVGAFGAACDDWRRVYRGFSFTARNENMHSKMLRLCFLAMLVLVLGHGRELRAAGKDVALTLKITDRGNFTLEAKKAIATETNAFDATRHIVSIVYHTDAEAGPVVTSMCGVAAPKGSTWVPFIDGKPLKQGIGKLTLTADTTIEWKIERVEKAVKPEKPEKPAEK